MVELKKEYIDRIKNILSDDEFSEYINSFNYSPCHGFSLNKKKFNENLEEFEMLLKNYNAIFLKENLYSYEENMRPGKSVFFDAGLYYIQEPSQMNAVLNLNIQENDIVLDLCAAPGGKSIQALHYLNEEKGGYLIANEIDSKRAKVLSSNIERLGYANIIVCNHTANELSNTFINFFDKIIVDAPCSGEGMFRKDENAINEWSISNINLCVERQKNIIDCAYNMLKNGGIMSYSTCTFEKCENEDIVEYIITKHPNIKKLKEGRVYPFTKNKNLIPGEGHYFCILMKQA